MIAEVLHELSGGLVERVYSCVEGLHNFGVPCYPHFSNQSFSYLSNIELIFKQEKLRVSIINMP